MSDVFTEIRFTSNSKALKDLIRNKEKSLKEKFKSFFFIQTNKVFEFILGEDDVDLLHIDEFIESDNNEYCISIESPNRGPEDSVIEEYILEVINQFKNHEIENIHGNIINNFSDYKLKFGQVGDVVTFLEPEEFEFEESFIAITGKLQEFARDEFIDIIEGEEGNYQSTVNKKTTLLVIGDNPGKSKLDKAKSLGIKTMSEEDFIEILEDLGIY